MRCISKSTILLVSSLASALLCAGAFAASPGCIVVVGDRILLRHLSGHLPEAAVADPDRPIAFAPRPGVRRTLLFREWAGGARQPFPGEPDEICVEREARTLTREDLSAALVTAFEGAGRSLTVEVRDFPKGPVPAGTLIFPEANLKLARPDSDSGVAQLIGYAVFGSDPARPQRFPIWVRARIEADAKYVELTCLLAAGDEIKPTCMKERTVRAYPFAHGEVSASPQALAGRAARRALSPGTVLRERMFHPRQDVRPRQEISLLVRCGHANIRLTAMSETGGVAGETVTVRLADSKRRLRVLVMSAGVAELLVPRTGAGAMEGNRPEEARE